MKTKDIKSKSWPMKENSSSIFQKRVKEALENGEISAYELAAKSGLSNPMIYNVRDGKTDPSLTSAQKIANALGYTLSQFIANEPKIDHDVDECMKRVNKEWSKRS